MLQFKGSAFLTDTDEAQIICFSYGEALTLQYLVFALSNNTIKILVESRADGARSTEILPWFQYHRICYEVQTTVEQVSVHNGCDALLEEERGSVSRVFELLNPANLISKIFRKGSSTQKASEDSQVPQDEITLKEVIFNQISFAQLINFENYSNVLHFGGGQGLERLSKDLGDVYKSYSQFVFWKNSLDEEYCIIATLGGGLIFMKISSGKQVLLYKFPFGIQEMILIEGKNYSYLLLISDLGEILQFNLQFDKKSFKSILDSFESKEFRPYFLKFGHGAKLFFPLSNTSKKRRIFIYKEKAGELLSFKKKSLEKPERTFLIKLRNVLRISNFYDYLIVLSHQTEFRLTLVSKNVLSFKDKLRQEQEATKRNLENLSKGVEKAVPAKPKKSEGNFKKLLKMFVPAKEETVCQEQVPEKQQKQTPLTNAADFNLDCLKNAEKFCQRTLEREKANIVRTYHIHKVTLIKQFLLIKILDVLGPFYWNPERTNNKLMDKAIFNAKKYQYSSCLVLADRGVFYLSIDIEAGHALFLEKIGSADFKKEDFLCYEIFMKTHFTNHKKILKDLRFHLRKENKFSALFYFDMYRKFSSVEHKQVLLNNYIDLGSDPLVHSNMINYLLRSDFALKKKHLITSAMQVVYIMNSSFLAVPFLVFQNMLENHMLPSKQILNEMVAVLETNEYSLSELKHVIDPLFHSGGKYKLRVFQFLMVMKLLQHFVNLLFLKLSHADRFTKHSFIRMKSCKCDSSVEISVEKAQAFHDLQRGFSIGRLAGEFKGWGSRFLVPTDQFFIDCLTETFATKFEVPCLTEITVTCSLMNERSEIAGNLFALLTNYKIAYSDVAWFNIRSTQNILESFTIIKIQDKYLQLVNKFIASTYSAGEIIKKGHSKQHLQNNIDFLQKKTIKQLKKISANRRRPHDSGIKIILYLNINLLKTADEETKQSLNLASQMTDIINEAKKIIDISDVVFYTISLGYYELMNLF